MFVVIFMKDIDFKNGVYIDLHYITGSAFQTYRVYQF